MSAEIWIVKKPWTIEFQGAPFLLPADTEIEVWRPSVGPIRIASDLFTDSRRGFSAEATEDELKAHAEPI
jgi:hypothetical protein